MTHLRSHVQPQICHPGRDMGSYDWLYMVFGTDPAAHMIVISSRTTWLKLGRGSPKDINWQMVYDMEEIVMTHKLHHLLIQRNYKG